MKQATFYENTISYCPCYGILISVSGSSKMDHFKRLRDFLAEQTIIPKTLCVMVMLPLGALLVIYYTITYNILAYLRPEKIKKLCEEENVQMGLAPKSNKPDIDWFGIKLDREFVKYFLQETYTTLMYLSAFPGKPAPNVKVIDFQTKTETSILNFYTAGRPLLINFGSCT